MYILVLASKFGISSSLQVHDIIWQLSFSMYPIYQRFKTLKPAVVGSESVVLF